MGTERFTPPTIWVLVFGIFLLFLLTFSFPAPGAAAALCVKPGGGGGCFAGITDALNAANSGDTIDVAKGSYVENVVIDKTVKLRGGWNVTFTQRKPKKNITKITPPNGSAQAVVTIQGNIGNTAAVAPTLDGFTIAGGRSDNHGGGIRMVDSNAIVLRSVITDNVGYLYGGGIWVQRGAPVFKKNRIENNQVTTAGAYGGGIELEGTTAMLSNNIISNNVVSASAGYGGGIAINGGGPVALKDNTITGNSAAAMTPVTPSSDVGYGGGMAVMTSIVSIKGGRLLNNVTAISCEGYGGGLYALGSAVTIDAVDLDNNCAANTPAYGLGGALAFVNTVYSLTNTILVNNRAYPNDTSVGGIYADANSPGRIVNNTLNANKGQGIRTGAPATIVNNIIINHTTGISLTGAVAVNATANDFYNNGTDARGFSLDGSNILVNPQLDANNRLGGTSPAIDAGTRTDAPVYDIDNQPRPMAGPGGLYKFDIGADEYPGKAQTNFQICDTCADLTFIGPGNPQDNPNSTGSNDWIGFAAFGGDVNGDGKADLVAGAPNLSDDFDGGVNDSGRIFALYGNAGRRTGVYDVFSKKPSLEVRSWLHQQHIGRAFAAGDVNGDGKGDLIIGSIGGDDNGKPITGTVYIFSGDKLKGTKTLSPTMEANWRVRSGESTQTFSERSSLAAGALSKNAPDDIVIGETGATGPGNRAQAGAVRVLFGGAKFPALWDLGTKNANVTIFGPAPNAQLGQVAVGDVNGDGKLDLLARSQNTLYVFWGPLKGGTVDLASQAADVTITGLQAGWLAAGDVAGNTRSDAILSSGNQVVVVRGEDLNGTKTLAQAAFATFTNVSASALAAVNWDNKGKAEIVIGESSKNRAMALFGGNALQGQADAEARAGWILYGDKPTDQFGYSLSGADYDGDGIPDLILGSRAHTVDNHTLHFEDAGAVYVMYGSSNVTPK